MFKHFINLEDFSNQEIIKEKLIENFDYFSANLVCLFIRELYSKLDLLDIDLEDVIKKFDVNFNIKSKIDPYNNKISILSEKKIDIENDFTVLNPKITTISSAYFTSSLDKIEDSLKRYLQFISVITNTEYEKNINLNLYKALDLYHELNNKFNFGKKIQDEDVTEYLQESTTSVFNFRNSFITKIHLLLINEFGNDLHINFKKNKIWKHSSQDMNNHPDKSIIEQHEYYKLAKSLYSQFDIMIMDSCFLPVVNHNIKNIESNSFFDYEIESFKSAIEKHVLNDLLTSKNEIQVNKPKRI